MRFTVEIKEGVDLNAFRKARETVNLTLDSIKRYKTDQDFLEYIIKERCNDFAREFYMDDATIKDLENKLKQAKILRGEK